MLAKIWKKALLAVCIIACLFNVMYKLVNRTSLEIQLKSVENQASLLDIFRENITQENNSKSREVNSDKNQVSTNQTNQDITNDDDTIVVIN